MDEVRRPTVDELACCLEQHRARLTAYCDRMLASPFEAEDAVQETFVRAWRGFDRFEHRATLRSWLFRIARNVCLDMLSSKERRTRATAPGPASGVEAADLGAHSEATWIERVPAGTVATDQDPAEVAVVHETLGLAFLVALQRLPPRQRAVLFLCEVLRWRAIEVAELLDTTVASVNSALQRARAALATSRVRSTDPPGATDEAQRRLLARYLEAFEAYDIAALTALIAEDAGRSPPRSDRRLRRRGDRCAASRGSELTALGTASR